MKLISRSKWGARHRAGFGPRKLPTSQLWLHHTVTLAPDLHFQDLNADSVDDDEAKAMRVIEDIGQDRFGAGFSYNVAVMPSGRLYEGCGVDRVGAHTAKRNTTSFGLVLVGNYEANPVPEPMKLAVTRFVREAHQLGWIDQPKFDGGHRDLKQTSCPGINAYRLIPEFNKTAPAPTPTPTPTESKVYFLFSDAGLDWRSDGIVRSPFETQEAKNAWVADIQSWGGKVTRRKLTREQIERLVVVGLEGDYAPAPQ